MGFLRANGGVVHYRDEGRRDGSAIVLVNALGSDLRIWDDVAAAPRAGLPRRPLRQARPRPQRSRPRPLRHGRLRARPRQASSTPSAWRARPSSASRSAGSSRRSFTASARSFSPALVLSDTAAKIGDDASWDARIAAIEAGGVEAVADGVLQRWFTADFRARRADELAGWRTMLVRTPRQGYLAACGALKRADLRPFAGAISVPDAVPCRRRGRLDARRPGARDRRARQRRRVSRSSPAPATFPGSNSQGATADLVARHAERAATL